MWLKAGYDTGGTAVTCMQMLRACRDAVDAIRGYCAQLQVSVMTGRIPTALTLVVVDVVD